jgi:hypothetical protein
MFEKLKEGFNKFDKMFNERKKGNVVELKTILKYGEMLLHENKTTGFLDDGSKKFLETILNTIKNEINILENEYSPGY